MKNSRLLMLGFLVVLLLGILSPVAIAQDVVNIVWWTESGDEVEEVLIPQFADAFNEAHPGIHLEIIGQESTDTVRTAIQAGEAPDIIQTPGASFIAEFVDAGLILPMTDYAAEFGWEDKLLPWAYNSGILDGDLYSIPITYESIIMIYNKTLFEANGWEVPTTLEELDAVANEMTEMGISPFALGSADWQPTNEWLMSIYLNNYAGVENVYAALTGELSWEDPIFAEATSLLKTHIADNGWFSGDISNYYANTWDDYWIELANGEAGMMMNGTWSFCCASDYFEETGQEWGWAPLPVLSDAAGEYNYQLATGSTISINGFTEHPDETAIVIDYLLSDPARILSIASEVGFGEYVVPLHFSVEDFPEDTDPRVAEFFADFAKVTSEGRFGYTTWTFWPADPNVQLWTSVEEVWAGDLSVEDYLAEHQALWEDARAEGSTLAVPGR